MQWIGLAISLFGFALLALNEVNPHWLANMKFFTLVVTKQEFPNQFSELSRRCLQSDLLSVKQLPNGSYSIRWSQKAKGGDEDMIWRLLNGILSESKDGNGTTLVVKASTGAFLFVTGWIPIILNQFNWNLANVNRLFSLLFWIAVPLFVLTLTKRSIWREARELQSNVLNIAVSRFHR